LYEHFFRILKTLKFIHTICNLPEPDETSKTLLYPPGSNETKPNQTKIYQTNWAQQDPIQPSRIELDLMIHMGNFGPTAFYLFHTIIGHVIGEIKNKKIWGVLFDCPYA
jgi:hypothetical protein